jgi:hypothetical protein
MYQQGLVILARFRLMTGHLDPHFEPFRANYARMIREADHTDAQIEAALASI